MTCKQGHGQISYKGRKCPLCKALDYNRKLSHTVNSLQHELLVSENEMLLDFDITGERKIFSYVGQA
jgi:hypothetical protein